MLKAIWSSIASIKHSKDVKLIYRRRRQVNAAYWNVNVFSNGQSPRDFCFCFKTPGVLVELKGCLFNPNIGFMSKTAVI